MGCAPDVPLQRLLACLGLLYEYRADLELDVTYVPTAQQLQQLRDGDLDLGLLHDTGPTPGINAERLYRGELLAAVVCLSHRVAARESAQLADLAHDVLLVAPRGTEPALHDRIVALSTIDGAAFRTIREAPGPDVRDLLLAVARSHGVTIAPRSTLRVAGDLGEAVAARLISPPAWMPDTCLAWPANRRPELSGVYAVVREVARTLYRPQSISPCRSAVATAAALSLTPSLT
jgi:DNA-binding transcriptional LysR family regulator